MFHYKIQVNWRNIVLHEYPRLTREYKSLNYLESTLLTTGAACVRRHNSNAFLLGVDQLMESTSVRFTTRGF